MDAYPGDPERSVRPGDSVSLISYADGSPRDSHGPFLQPHEHPFAWTGVPPQIVQGGHSGAPVIRNGRIVAIFTGATGNSYGCQWLCGKRWPTKLRFVNVASIRSQARALGFDWSAP